MWNSMLIRLFNNIIRTHKAQAHKHWQPNVIVFRTNNTSINTINTDLFSSEDQEKILKTINDESMQNLLQYSISKKRAQYLESHRTDHGPYNSLEDLLKIKGMNKKCLYAFYKSIICRKTSKKKIIRGLVVTPKTTGNSQKDVETVLGIHIGPNIISWSLLNRDCEVLQWNYKSFPESRPRENLHTLLQATLPIATKLPKADRYVMQQINDNMGYQSRKYNAHIQQSVISAIILSHLTTSNCKFDNISEFITNNIFMLRQKILCKVYGLIIDKEIISAQYMSQKLFDENDGLMKSKERLPSLLLTAELREMYNAQSSVYREQISWSLLIALAFLEIVVHEKTDVAVRNTM